MTCITSDKRKKKQDLTEQVPKTDLVEGEDYYLDDSGLMVFTARYHLARGHCCESGCRHCPYGTQEGSE